MTSTTAPPTSLSTTSATATKQSTTSLLTEHFRYTPLTLLDDIINTINELTYRAVDAVQAGLSSADPASLGFTTSDATTEIETGTHALETLLQSAVDRNFDKLEIYVLRSLLKIPDGLDAWMRLGHYEGLDFSAAEGGEGGVEGIKKLLGLRRQVLETRRLNARLLEERARNEALLTHLRALLSPGPDRPDNLAFLNSATSTSKPMQAQASDIAAQVPALRKLLVDLRRHLDAGISLGEQAKAGTEAERERREYIEGVVGRAVGESGPDSRSAKGGATGDVSSMEGIRDVVGRGAREDG
ncbi:MAG: hypothetical protein M1828_001294 [Chrysothrix sp. TS-e1954]|nr:MAG: hypothetical protein M1828_001294 [Chrysothrix sp. TS-e1954]